ncbi:MAG: hypothetical protein HY762_00780 [Planctomycetes bacterium]|nr:hypothetical protein [Planctomycetota bacterium]
MFLKSAPIKVDKLLKELLFDRIKTAVLTSATMATSTTDGLKYIKETVGLDSTKDLVLGSPFDYQKQVKLYITKNTPDPRTDKFEEAAGNKILKYLDITKGRAFVLFTSYYLMNKIHERLAPKLEQMGIPVYIQGRDLPRHQMLEQFKNRIGSVIFGADSFWQGVDVPGEALENIIITKLPFPVPSEPIVEAKIEDMERRGIDSFQNYFIPETALKLRQGFGRLIRAKTDKGIVVILDSRVLNKGYGKSFLDALPKCQIIVED